MWFVINKEEFLKILEPVVKVVPTRTPYPVIQNIILEITQKKLFCTGTDLNTYVKAWTEIEAEENRLMVPGKKLFEIVKGLPLNEVELSIENERLTIRGGNSKFSIPIMDVSEFPEVLEKPTQASFEISSTVLDVGYRKTKSTVTKQDNSRPAMNGILIDIKKDWLKFVSTDGHRLSLYKTQYSFETEKQLIVIPKVFSFLPGGDYPVKISFDDTKIEFSLSWMEIRTGLIEGPYPDYERVIPSEVKNVIKLNKELFISAVKRVMILSDEHTRRVKLHVEGNELILSSSTPEGGEGEERVECEYKGEVTDVTYNGKYLVEILGLIDDEKVVLGFNDASSPGVIYGDSEEKNPLYLLMPIVTE